MADTTRWTKNMFDILRYSSYFLYFIVYIGLWSSAPDYLDDLNYYLKIFVSIVLIYVFNPFYSVPYKTIHRDIAFTAGLILITTTSLDAFQKRIFNTIDRVIPDAERLIRHRTIT